MREPAGVPEMSREFLITFACLISLTIAAAAWLTFL